MICVDCIKGHHEILGHRDCLCVCHNNPQCVFCGEILLGTDVKDGLHSICVEPMNDAIELSAIERAQEPFGRYPWEL